MNLTPSDSTSQLRFYPELVLQAEGKEPAPGRRIVQLTDGRFVASDTARVPGTVTLWTPEGDFLTTIGREGVVHHEFGDRGRLSLLSADNGGFYVRDGHGVWWSFDASLRLTNKLERPGIGTISWARAAFPEGIIVTTQRMMHDPTRGFQLWRLADGSRELFGPDIDVEAALTRALSDTFWAAWTVRGGYTLELWDLSGQRQRSLERAFSEDERRLLSSPVRVSMLHGDREGQLIVFVVHAVERDREGRRDETLATLIVDVVDTSRGSLIYTEHTSVHEARTNYPTEFIDGTRRGYRSSRDLEAAAVEVVRYELESVV